MVTSTVQGPLYQAFIDALRGGGLRLSELLQAVSAPDRKPDELIRATDAGVAMGMFEVASGPLPAALSESPAAITVPLAFNRVVLESGSLGGRQGRSRLKSAQGSSLQAASAATANAPARPLIRVSSFYFPRSNHAETSPNGMGSRGDPAWRRQNRHPGGPRAGRPG